MSLVRILVVDDFEPWRRLVSSMLKKIPELQVICEASDGLEAVQKAEQLCPDLILLDIGLPRLNGIEAARRIRKLAPDSKIIFLSQESSADVAQEALRAGASGYVVKVDAGTELPAAIEAATHSKKFISASLVGKVSSAVSDGASRDYSQLQEVLASVAPLRPHRHEVRFYPDDTSFLDGFARFVSSALKAGDAVIVVATELHRNALLHRLHSDGLEIGTAIKDGRYISMDVADTLSTFMVNDLPDPVRFLKVAGELVATAAKAAKGDRQRVAACGECAPYLLAAGKTHAAIRLEQLWDRIAKTYDVDILCGYPLIGFGRPQESPVFQRICAEHSASYSG